MSEKTKNPTAFIPHFMHVLSAIGRSAPLGRRTRPHPVRFSGLRQPLKLKPQSGRRISSEAGNIGCSGCFKLGGFERAPNSLGLG